MNFLRSKAEQLAAHLRECIQRGEVVEPLLGIRAWSLKLGVSRRTLQEALWILGREGLISIGRQGIRLLDKPRAVSESTRRVRLLFYGPEIPNLHYDLEWIEACSERLHLHGIQFGIERCNAARLLAIASGEGHRNELLFLSSPPARYQKRFEESRKPAVLLGRAAPGVALPFLTVDQQAAIRHGTQLLLRRGFNRVTLVVNKTSSPGNQADVDMFRAVCAAWAHQPIAAETVLLPLDAPSLTDAARRLAARASGRGGFVVVAPVPIGLIMTALMNQGIEVGRQAEMVSVFHAVESVKLCPPPHHYPYPLTRLVKELSEIALHYFEMGVVPSIHKTLAPELARPC
jgi:DNA-binding LacI/PurR family transcriptional regulator